MSKSITLEVKVFGEIHALEVSSRREIAGKINDLFPAGDWDQVTRQARDFLLEKANSLWTREFGKGEPQTPKARKARPTGKDLASWDAKVKRGDVSLQERNKPLTEEETRKRDILAAKIEDDALWGKERKASVKDKGMTHKRSMRLLGFFEAIKGCKAPKQGPAIEMAMTPARKELFKKLRETRAAKKLAIKMAKDALVARFSSLGPVVINAAVETVVDRLEASDSEINCEAIKERASLEVVYKATREERNAYFAEEKRA